MNVPDTSYTDFLAKYGFQDVDEQLVNFSIPCIFVMPSTLEEFNRMNCSGNFANLLDVEKLNPGDIVREIKDPYIIKPVTLIKLK